MSTQAKGFAKAPSFALENCDPWLCTHVSVNSILQALAYIAELLTTLIRAKHMNIGLLFLSGAEWSRKQKGTAGRVSYPLVL